MMVYAPLFKYMSTEPALIVPGMCERRGGYRVPANALTLLGDNPQTCSSLDRLEQLLESRAFLPWVKDILMPHQREILLKALPRCGFSAWSPPGSGKTLCGLLWLAAAGPLPKVVVTKAAARGTWKEEIRKFSRFRPRILTGTKDVPPIRNDPRCIYITAWETLIYWKDALLKLGPHSLVMDEIHWAKNPKRVKPIIMPNGRTKFESLGNTASMIAQLTKAAERRFGLTATPIPNRPRDLWAQLDLVEPWQWGSFHQFGERYCAGFKDIYGWKYDGLSAAEELRERLAWSRSHTDQKAVMENLPSKRRQIVYLDRGEQDKPASVKRDLKAAAKTGDKTSIFEVLLREAATRKRNYVVERVLEAIRCKQKVVVFTGRRKDCEVLGRTIRKKVPKQTKVWCAHGGNATDERDQIRKEYMETEEGCVLIGTGDAWGESVNLQDTDLALFVMLPWTPRSVRQWEGRFSRLGQKRPVLISYVIARGTVDEHVAEILIDKLPAVGTIADDEMIQEIEGDFMGTQVDLLDRVAQL